MIGGDTDKEKCAKWPRCKFALRLGKDDEIWGNFTINPFENKWHTHAFCDQVQWSYIDDLYVISGYVAWDLGHMVNLPWCIVWHFVGDLMSSLSMNPGHLELNPVMRANIHVNVSS